MDMAERTTQAETAQATQPAAQPLALRISERLRRFVDFVGRWGAWLVVPMVLFTIIDVIARKISWLDDAGRLHGVQVFLVATFGRMFESTMLQELEWHFHAGLFALVLGYGYIHNAHVRVDLIRENLSFRKKAWLELLGITFFLIPFCATIIWFSFDYAHASYQMHEISASTVGLTHRWIIKTVLFFGLIVALLAGISVWLQIAVILFADDRLRFPLMTLEWPEEAGSKIEGKERVKLEESMDALAAPDDVMRQRTSKILTGG
ncbi:MAG TPA: TRAP transporter small permease subunit [Burkholderiales bacterium]|nr:TRAP transporter small permease subunit [Burkholderiales bacterium]